MRRLPCPDDQVLAHAPERALLFVLDAALASTQHALRREHPTLHDPCQAGCPPRTLLLASVLHHEAEQLRWLLREYEHAVSDALQPADTSDLDAYF